jgi:hypothetical protein
MQSYLQNLYNNGDNNGDIKLCSKDNVQFSCHSIVIKTLSNFISTYNTLTQKITINYDKRIIDILLHYMYTEKILEEDLSIDDILSLFELISFLQVKNINELKNYFTRQFPHKLNSDNWQHILRTIYGIQKYSPLFEQLTLFIKNIIFRNNKSISQIIDDNFDSCIKSYFLKISLLTIKDLNIDISNLIEEKDTAIKEKMNFIIQNSDEQNDIDSDSDTDSDSDIEPKKPINKKITKKKK